MLNVTFLKIAVSVMDYNLTSSCSFIKKHEEAII